MIFKNLIVVCDPIQHVMGSCSVSGIYAMVPLTLGNQNLPLIIPATQPSPLVLQMTPSSTDSAESALSAFEISLTPEAQTQERTGLPRMQSVHPEEIMTITREESPYNPSTSDGTGSPVNRWLTTRFQVNWETWVFVIILLLAIFTRFYNLGTRTMSHDESLHTKFSWDLYSNGVFQHTPLMHGPILFHMTALDYFLFGDNDFTARIYPAVLGMLMVMFPLLFRRWMGRWGAILASIMFLISPLILYYNRYIREDTPSIFFTFIMVYCTLMYLNGPPNLRRKARWLYIFSAAMLGSMATKEVVLHVHRHFWQLLAFTGWCVWGNIFGICRVNRCFISLSLTVLLVVLRRLACTLCFRLIPLEHGDDASGSGTLEFASLIKWTLAVIVAIVVDRCRHVVLDFRRSIVRIPGWMCCSC